MEASCQSSDQDNEEESASYTESLLGEPTD